MKSLESFQERLAKGFLIHGGFALRADPEDRNDQLQAELFQTITSETQANVECWAGSDTCEVAPVLERHPYDGEISILLMSVDTEVCRQKPLPERLTEGPQGLVFG